MTSALIDPLGIFSGMLSTVFTDLSTVFVYNFYLSTTYPLFFHCQKGLFMHFSPTYQHVMHNLWITLPTITHSFPHPQIQQQALYLAEIHTNCCALPHLSRVFFSHFHIFATIFLHMPQKGLNKRVKISENKNVTLNFHLQRHLCLFFKNEQIVSDKQIVDKYYPQDYLMRRS